MACIQTKKPNSLLLWIESKLRKQPSTPCVLLMLTVSRHMKIENLALTRIQSFPLLWGKRKTGDSSPEGHESLNATSHFLLSEASGLSQWPGSNPTERSIEKAVLYTAMQIRSSFNNRPVGIVNHSSWMIADSKAKPLLALDPKEWSKATKQPSSIQKLQVPWYQQTGEDRWIELVLNNMDETGHPFHLVS